MKRDKDILEFSICWKTHFAEQEVQSIIHALFLSLVLTPCLAERSASWLVGNRLFIKCVLLSFLPTQGARRACVSQTGIQRGRLQQTSPSPTPGAELFLAVPLGTVGPAQEPSSPNPPASRSQSESVRRSGIHGWGHPRDTSVSFSIMRSQPDLSSPPTPCEVVQMLREIACRTDSLSACGLWLCAVE